jgi:hypothetical protein
MPLLKRNQRNQDFNGGWGDNRTTISRATLIRNPTYWDKDTIKQIILQRFETSQEVHVQIDTHEGVSKNLEMRKHKPPPEALVYFAKWEVSAGGWAEKPAPTS